MITIKDIAKRAGVSYATVSRALNNRADVNAETRCRILKLAEKMGYRPNVTAQNLVNKRSNVIALIVPDVSNPFFADISRAVSEAASEAGFITTVCNTGWDPTKEQDMLNIMQSQRVAGMIIKPTGFYEPGTFEAINVPLVVFWHPTADQTNYIEVDHSEGGRLATRHLIERGYREIAYLGGAGTSPANNLRVMAYQQTLQEHNLAVDPELISFGGFDLQSGYNRIAQMLANNRKKPDAVFCGNDYIALGVLQYLHEKGIRTPEEFGVIGYDDIYFSGLPMINLSSVRQPRDELGKQAFELLNQTFESEENSEMRDSVGRKPARMLISPTLQIRGTT